MKQSGDLSQRSDGSKKVNVVLITLLVSALFLPFGYSLDLGPGPDQIRALTWEYLDAPWFSGFRFAVDRIGESIAYTLPRYLYIFLLLGLYSGRTNLKTTIWTGIFGELFPGIVSLILILGLTQGWSQSQADISNHQFPIYIPIPSLFLIGLLILRLFPSRMMKDNGAS